MFHCQCGKVYRFSSDTENKPNTSEDSKRGRGRPKGSKNKSKRGPGRPKGSKNKSKRGPGRPKGIKNKSKTSEDTNTSEGYNLRYR